MKQWISRMNEWWKQFVKDHLIDEVDPDDPDF